MSDRSEVLREAAEHLRTCARRWDGGDLGRFPILRHKWRDALRTGVGFAAMELDNLARQEDQ